MDVIFWQLLIEGVWMIFWILVIVIVFGVVVGLLIVLVWMLCLLVIDQLLVVYISLVCVMLLVMLVLFLFFFLFMMGINFDKNVVVIVVLMFNMLVFNVEIWCNVFCIFLCEQWEVVELVGMCCWIYFCYIMLLQMWIESLLVLVNEMFFLIKGSFVIVVIGVVDFIWVINCIFLVIYELLLLIFVVGLLYVVIIGCLLKLQGIVECKVRCLVCQEWEVL